jgi:hypothetical protein
MAHTKGPNHEEAVADAQGMIGAVFLHVEYGWCVIDGWGVDDEVHEEGEHELLLFYTKTLRRRPSEAINCFKRYEAMRACIARSPDPPLKEKRRYANMPLTRYCVNGSGVELYLPDINSVTADTAHAARIAS